MYQELKNNKIKYIKARADLLSDIRNFFKEKNVLEVETPLLASTAATDPHLSVMAFGDKYLQTSPEYAMKRLLSEGSGCIYQICKAFRANESGKNHNSEFTMLEWYRLGFDYNDLMLEMADLLQLILGPLKIEKITYQDLFLKYLNFDPFDITLENLKNKIKNISNISNEIYNNFSKDDLLSIIFNEKIEPLLKNNKIWFVYNYPATQAMLAKTANYKNNIIAKRFEVYINSIELANGYEELSDSKDQEQRAVNDNLLRKKMNIPNIPIDYKLLKALDNGFPECSGVALGIDRLLMLKTKANSIKELISFPSEDI